MCPFILSGLPEGIPSSTGAALCSHGNGTGSRRSGRAGNPSLGMSGAVGLPGTPLATAGTGRAFGAWQQEQAQRLAGIRLPKQMFEKAKTWDKKRTAVWWYSQEALQIPPPRSCVAFLSLDSPKQVVASRVGEL